jgi:2'-5' RNA ligase
LSDGIRLFLALWPGPATRERLADAARRWHWPAGAKPVAAERLHLTLHFLGTLPRARLDAIARGLEVPFAPFSLAFDRDELWGNGIAALRPRAPLPEVLPRLHVELAEALRRLDLEPEARAWRPHVTLARHAQGAALPPAKARRWRWPVRGYALVESVSQPTRGYRVLQRYPSVPRDARAPR